MRAAGGAGRGFPGPAPRAGVGPATPAGKDRAPRAALAPAGAPWQAGCRAGPAAEGLRGRLETSRPARAFRGGGGGGGRALPGPGAVSGGGVWEPAAGASRRDRRAGVEGPKPRKRAEPGGAGRARGGHTRRTAGMFSRNHRSRVTVARGSALEMEFKRGRFRLSLLSDPPEVRAPRPPARAAPDTPGRRAGDGRRAASA